MSFPQNILTLSILAVVALPTFAAENEEVQNLIWEEIQKANEYTSSLQIRKFRMLTKELDHEDGDLTATQKAKRNVIMEKFSDLIEDMYK